MYLDELLGGNKMLEEYIVEKIKSLENLEIGDRAESITASIAASEIYCYCKKIADTKEVDCMLNKAKLRAVKERHMTVIALDKTISNDKARESNCIMQCEGDPLYQQLAEEIADMEKEIIELRSIVAHHKNIYMAILVMLGFADGSFVL